MRKDSWGDRVNLIRPRPEGPEAFYCCGCHELVHGSGHKDRLNGSDVSEVVKFGGHV